MKFTPKSEKELAEDNLLPLGTYDFEIVDAEEKTSKAGNDMIVIKHHIFDSNGNPRIIFDYLMEQLAYKLRHAADACGLLDHYESGALEASDFKGKTGKLKLTIQKSKDPQYADKNVVADYVKREASNGKQPPAGMLGEGKPLDDEIPF